MPLSSEEIKKIDDYFKRLLEEIESKDPKKNTLMKELELMVSSNRKNHYKHSNYGHNYYANYGNTNNYIITGGINGGFTEGGGVTCFF